MLKEIRVSINKSRTDGETLYFTLCEIQTGKTYELRYCHRTDTPWYTQCLIKCYCGELFHNGTDLGVAFMLSTRRSNILSYKEGSI